MAKRGPLRRWAAHVAGSDGGTAFFEAFTPAAKAVIVAAEAEARALSHTSIGPEHILLAMHTQPSEPAAALLSELGATRDAMVGAVQAVAPPAAGAAPDRVPFTARSKEAFVLARAVAVGREDAEVGSGHLLLGLLRQPEGAARAILAGLGVQAEKADAALLQRMATQE